MYQVTEICSAQDLMRAFLAAYCYQGASSAFEGRSD